MQPALERKQAPLAAHCHTAFAVLPASLALDPYSPIPLHLFFFLLPKTLLCCDCTFSPPAQDVATTAGQAYSPFCTALTAQLLFKPRTDSQTHTIQALNDIHNTIYARGAEA